MAYYEVVCRCGHVGNGNYVLKSFAVYGESRKEAARTARYIPRVKHDNKHVIEDVIEVDKYRFQELILLNNMDPYFRCRNKRQQRAICDLQICRDEALLKAEQNYANNRDDSVSRKVIYQGKKKIKNPHKFYKHYRDVLAA